MSHSAAGGPERPGRRGTSLGTALYSAAEWRLLARLPGRVMVVSATRRVAEPVAPGLAGLEGIAAGRASDSDLVRAVVAAVYAEAEVASETYAQVNTVDEVFAECARAVEVLAGRADPADSAAYRQWVQSVAARVCRAARPEAADGGADPDDQRFLAQLGAALGLCP
ncbi:hypothetical protein [Melissospora conviva]|uniref:hypothetical protein n=1 Tax=Melissospora conviva TaxID=3388432 RepID=UPI003C1B684A